MLPAPNTPTVASAIELWRNGRPQDAELACEAVLSGTRDDPDAISLLAEIYSATGRPELAGHSLQRLLGLGAQSAATYRRLGDAWLAAGRAQEAQMALRRALELEPDSVRAHNNLGQALLRLGRPSEALQHFERALELHPDYAIGHNNRGLALADLGRLEEALDSYRRAATLTPGFWEAHYNCGNVLRRLQRLPESLSCYSRAIELQPAAIDALLNRGSVQQQVYRFDSALADFQRVLALQPAHALALVNKAAALLDFKRAGEALQCSERALSLQPNLAWAHRVRARALKALSRYQEALAACARCLELEPDSPQMWCDRGELLDDMCQADAARECYLRAMALDAHCSLARVRLLTSHIPIVPDSEEEILRSRRALDEELTRFAHWARSDAVSDREAPELVDQLFYLAYQGLCDRALLERHRRECVRLMARWQAAQGELPAPPRVDVTGTRLRIGIVSAHVADHSVYKALVHGWLRQLDRERFEFHVFHVGSCRDPDTSAAAALSDRFITGSRTLAEWVAAVRASHPDVLIFPEVGMDRTTLRLAALRLAPQQLAAWGHPETTGLTTIDYYLSGAAFEPAGAQQHYCERLRTLPALGSYYEPYGVAAATLERERLGIAANEPLFICAGLPFKYAPQYDHVLADIAQRLGPCQFVFFTSPRTTATARLSSRLMRTFERAGLDPSRYLRFIPWLPRAEFFGLLQQADACLDTIGFSGFNTAMQVIECGLPIVAYRGAFMRGRFASGILEILGVPELIADDPSGYVERAVRIAQDRPWRVRLREQLLVRRPAILADQSVIAEFARFLLDLPRPARDTDS
jgi:protein O-GlcNAc transferase